MRRVDVVAQPAGGRSRAQARGWPAELMAALAMRTIARAALIALALTFALLVLLLGGSRSAVAPSARTGGQALELSLASQAAISRSIGHGERTYWAHPAHGEALAARASAALNATYDAHGVLLRRGHDTVDIALAGIGGAAQLNAPTTVRPRGQGNLVTYSRPGVREWYASGPLGLEQGFDVAHPVRGGHDLLTLAVTFAGTLRPELEAGAHGLVLSRAGDRALLYRGLSATDATGRPLQTWLSLHGRLAQIHVDVAGATYPIHVDPFIQEGEKLVGAGGKGGFGVQDALSNDGATVVIGEFLAKGDVGKAYVYTRSGAIWTKQAELTPEGLEGNAQFGEQVAISGDGNTAIVGGYQNNSQNGAVWVFTRSGTEWKEQQKLAGEHGGLFGGGLAISEDGNTALIGEQNRSNGAYIYKRSAGKWKLVTTLTPKGVIGGGGFAGFGEFGALSGDGRTAAVSAPSDNGEIGAVWTYAESGGVWKQQAKLVGGEIEKSPGIGPVALSSDGTTLLMSGQNDGSKGSAWVFTRAQGVWSQQGPRIRATEVTSGTSFGTSVALSGDGNTALIGGGDIPTPGDGAIWVFTRSEGAWTQQGTRIEATGESGEGSFGNHIAFSRDGFTALAGGYTDNGLDGAVWTLAVPPTVETGPAAAPGTSGFTLTGTVNVHGHHSAECVFEYGTSTAYGTTVSCSPATVSGEGAVGVSAALSGLAEGTYHYRVRVTNLLGTFYGPDQSAATLASVASASTSEPAVPAEATDGPLSARATGGTGTITVGAYGPTVGGPLLPSGEGGYVDVYHSSASSFTQVVAKECKLKGARTAWWYDPAAGWRPMPSTTAVFELGCATITITATSSPSLSQLTGTRIKFGEPPGTFGQCRKSKKVIYSDSKCLEKHSKNGTPDGKGTFEWYEPPVCFAQKKGFFAGAGCEHRAESSKGKGEGDHEKGNTRFTGTSGEAQIEIAGAGTVKCSTATAAGEWSGPIRGTETITFSGCTLAGHACSGSEGLSGVIRGGALETLSAEEQEAGGKTGYYLVLAGSREPFAVFTCNGTSYTVGGAIEGRLVGTVNEMSTSAKAEFGTAVGKQELLTQYGSQEGATKVSLVTTTTSSQALELDTAVALPIG